MHTRRVVGRVRRYLLHDPPGLTRHGAKPLVIVLHGDKGTAAGIRRLTGFDAVADRAGFLVVYPEGTGWAGLPMRSWNAGNCCGYPMGTRVDDVAFIRTLVDELVQTGSADARRVYITGFSNGGMMAYRLACELSDRLTAIAPVAGAMAFAPCAPTRPVSVLAVHGTADAHVPYEGGRSLRTQDERVDVPVADAVSFWVRHNGCSPQPETTLVGLAARTRYTGCRGGTEVVLYTLDAGGHEWPGRRARDVPTTELLWEFFSQHTAP